MKKELQLYVHIPFCVEKCAYCDFLSWTAKETDQRRYAEALTREIEIRAKAYKGYKVTTVFVGGGTPSILPTGQMTGILRALHENFQINGNAEFTLEANPGTVTAEKLDVWREAGVNRLSIGLQSASDRELGILGRIHTWKVFMETYDLARKRHFQNINIDLMSAIPGQTVHSWKESLQMVVGLKPEHISAYSLILEEGTPFYDRYKENKGQEPLLPGEYEEEAMDELTGQVLGEYGYIRYEISNYAKAGYECQHNLGYWERKEYLGLGLGASSLVSRTRFQNTANMGEYLKLQAKDEEFFRNVECLSLANEIEEFMFLGLRKITGISKNEFKNYFGRDIEEIYGSILEKLCKEELLCISGDMIRLTPRGLDLSNVVFVQFMQPSL